MPEFRIYTKRIEKCGECPNWRRQPFKPSLGWCVGMGAWAESLIELSHLQTPPDWCPLPKEKADAE